MLATWLCRRRLGGWGRPGGGIRGRQSGYLKERKEDKPREKTQREKDIKEGGGQDRGEHILERKSIKENNKDDSKHEKYGFILFR